MGHSDADRNFWVRSVFCFLLLVMIGACVFIYGKGFSWKEWTGTGFVFLLISLAIILPPKVYLQFITNINFAGIASVFKFGRRKDDDNGQPPDNPTDPKPPVT